jgi:hypothetical protein
MLGRDFWRIDYPNAGWKQCGSQKKRAESFFRVVHQENEPDYSEQKKNKSVNHLAKIP